jgi:hypothetical protein
MSDAFEEEEEDQASKGSSEIIPAALSSQFASNASSYVDRFEDFLRKHQSFVDAVQSMVLMRRPLELAVFVAILDGLFLLHRRLALPSVAVFAAALTFASLSFIAGPSVAALAKPYLFRAGSPRGELDEANRIRDSNEILELFRGPVLVVGWVVQVLHTLASDDTRDGRIIWAGVLAWLCVLTAYVDWPLLLAIVLNIALIVPGIWLNPRVVAWRSRLGRQAPVSKAEQETPEAVA